MPSWSRRYASGRRWTRTTTAPQNLASPEPRPTSGSRSPSTRSPSSERTAGSRVVAAATAVSPTRIAPAARLRRIVSGTSSIPVMAITNAVPLKRTARLAVRPVATTASTFSVAPCPLFAEAADDEEGVVDAEREPHPREHVDDEEGDLPDLADDRDERERDDDRDDREQDRDQPRDDGAEDEQQHDQRRRQPEEELALLQILVREREEVVVGGELARDRHRERPVVGLLDDVDHVLDPVLGIPPHPDRDRGRIAVGREQAWILDRRSRSGPAPCARSPPAPPPAAGSRASPAGPSSRLARAHARARPR